MTAINTIIKMHARDKNSWYSLPWFILFSSFVVNLIISYYVLDTIYTGGLSSIYIYYFVAGIIVAAQNFPFALGFSIRRKDFFLGTMGHMLICSAINSIILIALGLVEEQTNAWGSELYFFNIPYLSDGGLGAQLCNNFMLFMFLFISGFLINCIYRRSGRNGMFILFLGITIIFTIFSATAKHFNWWVSIGEWFSSQTALGLSLWLFPVTVIFAGLSYVLLRKATV